MTKPKYLTKSRFKTAYSCATKLYYVDRKEYGNNNTESSFMEALAEGGFQVGALAKVYIDGGVDLEGLQGDEAVERTEELLKQKNVIIYEAAIQVDHFLIRIDILRKNGDQVDLIEVKAKSHDFESDDLFAKRRTSKKNSKKAEVGSEIDSKWEPYLVDVAFQTFVLRRKHPKLKVTPYLYLIDKRRRLDVDGLHQRFLLRKENGRARVIVKDGTTRATVGTPILTLLNVSEETEYLLQEEVYPGPKAQDLEEYATYLSDLMKSGKKAPPRISKDCKGCEFRISRSIEAGGLKSGFKECWLEAGALEADRMDDPLIMDLWDNRRGEKHLADNKVYLDELVLSDIEGKAKDEDKAGMSRVERQWLQILYAKGEKKDTHLDLGYLESFLGALRYPLHFIDFETAMAAIPFHRDLRPYEQLAYQFSHHLMQEDGRVEHKTQYLHVKPGEFPNFEFARALKKALENDNGTVFRYAAHENTVLNDIVRQLEVFQPSDWKELKAFIQTLTRSGSGDDVRVGPRLMRDLCQAIKECFYDPRMGGSNSIKVVTPTLLNISKELQDKYSQPIYGRGCEIPSLNFGPTTWVSFADGKLVDPYKGLPAVEVVDGQSLTDIERVNEGGGASIAWARMQFTEMSEAERTALAEALLRYCELDTLSMVWILEFFRSRVK